MTDSDRLGRIEEKLDRLDARLSVFQLHIEHRTTKLEGRASLFGVFGGLLAVVISYLIKPWHN